jgi:alkyldihydroxyacetonephosphate synthase
VLPALYERCVGALQAIGGTLAASAHQSHAYGDGACLYFTFAGRMADDPAPKDTGDPSDADTAAGDAWAEQYYESAWSAVMTEVMAHGGAISHHHGIGINRSSFMAPALGGSLDVLAAVKEALDPRGILNPGKLGLPSPFGELRWP